MRVLSKSLIAVFFAGVVLFVGEHSANANEGVANLSSLTERPYRCTVTSGKVGSSFNLLTLCKDIIYPNLDDPYASVYILWANPISGGKPIKLGDLKNGNRIFKTSKLFDSLFVTTEIKTGVKTPKGTRIMSGTIKPNTFLNSPSEVQEPLATIAPDDADEVAVKGKIDNTNPKSGKSITSTILRWVGILASVILLVALVGFVIVIAKSRR